MTVSTITITPSAAARAYSKVESGDAGEGSGFGDALSRALGSVIQAGHDADAKSMQAISGTGNLTEVVTAVARAELALQTTTAIRDRVVQAYQDIMRMPI